MFSVVVGREKESPLRVKFLGGNFIDLVGAVTFKVQGFLCLGFYY